MLPRNKSIITVHEIRKNEVIYINDERTPCQNKERTEEMNDCIQHHIENKMECQLPWYNERSILPRCNESDQYEEFLQSYIRIASRDEASIAKVTGCLPSCKRNEFDVRVINRVEMASNEAYFSGLFYYPSGGYDEKIYYYTYALGDYIADVGGYMGLLLGYSLISFYDGFKYMLTWLSKQTLFNERYNAKTN